MYNVGDYVSIGGRKGRISQCFLHMRRGQKFCFIVGDIIQQVIEDRESLRDPVLDLPVYRQTVTQYTYGLPALIPNPIYIINAPYEPDWQTTESSDQYLLECDWRLAYL